MKILVLGATGKTGTHVVRSALTAGHSVTAFVREPARMRVRHPQLDVAAGEVTSNAALLTAAAQGCGAAISALGSGHSLSSVLSPTVMAEAMPVVVGALREVGVQRLVFMSSLGVGGTWPLTPASLKVMYKPALSRVFADKAAGERVLRASELDWTLVCPPMLTDGPRTGQYEAAERLRLGGMPRISRADVADFMVSQVESGTFSRSVVVLGAK